MMIKIHKIFYDFEKEENWLNQMSAKGLHLKAVGWCTYYFEKGKSGAYTYRLELLSNLPKHPESQEYINFIEDSGVEAVASYLKWVYFRKKAEDGPFEIFSDIDSKMRHYWKINTLFGSLMFLNLFAFIFNFIIALNLSRYTEYVGDGRGNYTYIEKTAPMGINFYISFINLFFTILIGSVIIRNIVRSASLRKLKRIVE